MAEVRRIEVPDARPADLRAGILDQIASFESVTRVVSFPDVHQKPRKEVPSSLAIATLGTIVPNFSSVNQNCGMAYLRTDLAARDLSPARLDRLADEIRRRVSAFNASNEPRVERDDIERSVLEGARWVCERFGLEPEALARVEDQGCMEPLGGNPRELLRLLPERLIQSGRRLFGLLGGGNHFIELQRVEELLEPEVCADWGVERGQVLLLFHTDSLGFGGEIGFLYGSRPVPGFRFGARLAARKLALHGTRLLDPHWWQALFGTGAFQAVSLASDAGQTLVAANRLNANFGYANRLAVGAALCEAVAAFDPKAHPRLFTDSNHNAIRAEQIDGRECVVHRHNAVRVRLAQHLDPSSPFLRYGAPIVLPGFADTSSYLARGLEGAAETLWSADHGGARLMARIANPGVGPPTTTRRYRWGRTDVEELPQRGDAGISALLDTLQREGVLRPVARLRPLATLKA